MSRTFLFTSDRASPHHEHTGYGLKEGLEEASREEVAFLESACVLLAAQRRVSQGMLIARGTHRVELWRGRVKVSLGQERSGRKNVSVTGLSPPLEVIRETVSWSWLAEGESGLGGVLVAPEAFIKYVRRQCTECSILDQRVLKKHQQKRRIYFVLSAIILIVIVVISIIETSISTSVNTPPDLIDISDSTPHDEIDDDGEHHDDQNESEHHVIDPYTIDAKP